LSNYFDLFAKLLCFHYVLMSVPMSRANGGVFFTSIEQISMKFGEVITTTNRLLLPLFILNSITVTLSITTFQTINLAVGTLLMSVVYVLIVSFTDFYCHCPCGETQTMSHIVEYCPLTKLDGGLSRLHSADEDAVSWLTSYGS